jgi:drug/metabolite transporter (DMT)-like permease
LKAALPSSFGVGFVYALGTLCLWSISPFFFTAVGRRIGAFTTNFLRVWLALPILLAACAWQSAWSGSHFISPDLHSWILLAASGIAGLSIGDSFFYASLAESGPERACLILTLAPVTTAVLAWIFIKEILTLQQWIGMALVLSGVVAAVWKTTANPEATPKGMGYAAAAAVCQAVGSILARQAFLIAPHLSALTATTIRLGAAAIVLLLAARWRGPLGSILQSARQARVAGWLLGGTLAGPVGGMLCYVAALKYAPAGIVTTIIFMSPILVFPLGAWHYGTRLGPRTLIGGAAALGGVFLLGWKL